MSRIPDRVFLCSIIAASLALQILIYTGSGYGIDDSLITFRYAENLITGHGLVYNVGERVQGSTSPLEIFLVAGFLFLGMQAKLAALLISLAATVGFLLCAFRLITAMSNEAPSPLVMAPLAVAPTIAVVSASGMETALFIFLQASVFLAYVQRKPWLLGFLTACLLLARIDGALVILAIIITDALLRFQRQTPSAEDENPIRRITSPWPFRDSVRSAGFACLLLLPWIAFTTWYYGNPIPNSIFAKRVLYSEAGMGRTSLHELLERIFGLGFILPWQIGACIAVGGLMFLAARRDRCSSIAVWFGADLIFLIIGSTHIHPWYLAPFHAFALIAVCGFASQLITRLPRWVKVGPVGISAATVCWLFIALIGAWGLFAGRTVTAKVQQSYENAHIAIARYLDAKAASDDIIYAPDIGYIGAITNRRILDSAGIVSPEVIPFNKRGDFAGVLKTLRPPWAVIGLYGSWQVPLLADSWVRQNYQPVYINDPARPVGWPSAQELRDVKYDWEYLVLRLKPATGSPQALTP